MKRQTVSDLSNQLCILNNIVADLEREVKFLTKSNLWTSVAGVLIFIVLGFVCYSMV